MDKVLLTFTIINEAGKFQSPPLPFGVEQAGIYQKALENNQIDRLNIPLSENGLSVYIPRVWINKSLIFIQVTPVSEPAPKVPDCLPMNMDEIPQPGDQET